MKCPECDALLQEQARFCQACGVTLPGSGRLPGHRLGNRSRLAERDEAVLWTGSFATKGLIHSWLLAFLITVLLPLGGSYVAVKRIGWIVILTVLGLIWGCLGLLLLLRKLNKHYELTDQRLIHRSGILVRRTNRIELIDIDDVSHAQGFIERFLGVGSIRITSSDRSHPVIELPAIDDVDAVAMLIDDARRRERIRRGIHIEQI